MTQAVYDTIIIGSGPAGLTAALYAGRFRLKTVMFEKMSYGGQIVLSQTIENFPGFPGGILTQDLVDKMKAQVDELEVILKNEEVLGISRKDIFKVKTADAEYATKTIILATGAQSKRLDVKGEEKFIGKGVSYCATCDGPLYRNKKVIVVGGGDRAFEEAIFLSEYALEVTLVHRRQEFRASAILIEKAKKISKIKFILDTVVEEISGGARVESVSLKNVQNGSSSKAPCDGVFIFVGIKPNTEFVKNILLLDEAGFIITAQDGSTSAEGIFSCGDCSKKSLYQVVNACGEAAVAADSVHKYLLKKV